MLSISPVNLKVQHKKKQTSFGCSSCKLGQEIIGTLHNKGVGLAEAVRYVELKSPKTNNSYGYVIDFKNKQNFDHETSIKDLHENVTSNLADIVKNISSLIK